MDVEEAPPREPPRVDAEEERQLALALFATSKQDGAAPPAEAPAAVETVLYRWIDGVKYNRVLLDLATTRARGVCLVDDDAQVLINAARDGGEVEERTLALIAKTYKATTSAERALEAAAVSIAAAEKPGASVGSSSFDTSAVASARCSQELRADREVVLAAVQHGG